NTDGIVSLPFTVSVRKLALQPDGKIVLAGDNLQRFNADGSVDTSFGSAGQASLANPADGVALDSAGRIVVASAIAAATGSVARFNADGTVDPTFGSGGQVALGFAPKDVALQANDQMIVAGSSLNGAGSAVAFALGRFDLNGSADATFGTNGVALTGLP